jgi:RNA polymerase sigma factor (sigma-70 family)
MYATAALSAHARYGGMNKAPPVEPTASELLVLVSGGDREAFSALFRTYAPQLRRYFLQGGADSGRADELVQEVLLTVWRRAGTYDPKRASPSTWIFTIARNKRIDALRREKRPEIDETDPALVAAPGRHAEAEIDAGRSRGALLVALETLPPEQARVLASAYFEDKPLPAIAEEAGVPLGTVKSRVRLALERLRSALKGEG